MELIVNELENANIQDVEFAKNIISIYDKEPDDILKKFFEVQKKPLENEFSRDFLYQV